MEDSFGQIEERTEKVKFALLFSLLFSIPQLSTTQPDFGAISGRVVWQTERHHPLEECRRRQRPEGNLGLFS